MIESIRSAWRFFVLIGFWVQLISCAVGGGIIGNLLSGYKDDHTAIGVIIGLVIGVVTSIQVTGFFATILNIDENIEKLRYNSSQSGTSSGGNSSGINISNVPPITPTINVGDSWVCKKCSERNPNTSSSCKGCGAYK